jgi:hypothetical protein
MVTCGEVPCELPPICQEEPFQKNWVIVPPQLDEPAKKPAFE